MIDELSLRIGIITFGLCILGNWLMMMAVFHTTNPIKAYKIYKSWK